MPIKREFKPKDGSIGFVEVLTDEQNEKRTEALKRSPDVNKLGQPLILDGGRTKVYFKPGSNFEERSKHFLEIHKQFNP